MNAVKDVLVRYRLSDIGLLAVVNLLLFWNALATHVNDAFGYTDELVALLLGFAAVVKAISPWETNRLGREGIGIVLCYCSLVALGLLSTAFQAIQTNISAIISDLYITLKFAITLLACHYLLTFESAKKLISALIIEGKVLVPIMLGFGILNLFIDIGMRLDEYRYGLTPFLFVYDHPSVVVWISIVFCSVFFTNKNKYYLFIIMSFCVIALTLRSKGICWVAAMIAVLLFMKKGKINLPVVLLGGLLVIIFAWDQIVYYYSSAGTETSRGALQAASFDIAKTYFPLGAGFSTFGSAVTASSPELYSPLYYEYGISNLWGMTIDDPVFIADSFWPIIFGQFGYLGVIATVALFSFLVKVALKAGSYWLPALSLVAYLLLCSFGETSIFNPNSILYAIMLNAFLQASGSDLTKQCKAGYRPNNPKLMRKHENARTKAR